MNDYLTLETKEISHAGVRYAYREMGRKEGIPLVLLPHLAATMDNWEPHFIDYLAQENRIIVFDNLGVGKTSGQVQAGISEMAEGVKQFLDALHIRKIHLLGLSMGGFIAQEFVLRYPEMVEKLILAGTGPRGGYGMRQVPQLTFRYMAKAILYRKDVKEFLFFYHDRAGQQAASRFMQSLNQREKAYQDKTISLKSFLRQLSAIKKWGMANEEDLSAIGQETLVLNGDNDLMVPTENSYRLAELISNSQLVIYPDSGHGAIFQFAKEAAATIDQFLKNKR